MSIDIDAIKGRIANGIYGDDRLTAAEIFNALDALDELVAEVEHLRGERAAVVAWLWRQSVATHDYEGNGDSVSEMYASAARTIERGEHRRKEER